MSLQTGHFQCKSIVKENDSTPKVASSREVLSIFVEGDGHDPVRGVECLLHTVAVVDVNVDVQDPLQKRGVLINFSYQVMKVTWWYFSNSRMARTMSLT